MSAVAGVATSQSPEPRSVLRAAGVASPEALEGARLHDVSRSHAVTLAELPDGSAYIVKRVSPEATDAGRSLAAELYAYRLASWRPDLASVLPTPVHLDERCQVVALVASPPEHLFPARCLEPGFPSPDLAAALGRSLATLHAATRDLPLLTVAACGVVGLPDAAEGERHLGSDSMAAARVADELVADPLLVTALRRTATALRPLLPHPRRPKVGQHRGRPGTPRPRAPVRLGVVGTRGPSLGRRLGDRRYGVPRRPAARHLCAPSDPSQWLTPPLLALLGAYADRANPAPSADTVTRCWTSRTMHLALECAASVDAADHAAVRSLLAAARLLAECHDDLAAAVDGALRDAS